MFQGGIQATEAMLYTVDMVNKAKLLGDLSLGVIIKDDCDTDTYGLEQTTSFIKGRGVLSEKITTGLILFLFCFYHF